MMRFFNLLLSVLSLTFLTYACGISGPLRDDKQAQGYVLGPLPDRWTALPKNGSGADSVFENKSTGSLLAVNSLCDRYPDADLDDLLNQLLVPFSEKQVVYRNKKTLDGRDSLWTRVSGKLDGVPVESMLAVYRKDNCIFDFQLHARGKLTATDESDYDRFVNGFHYRQGP